MDEKIIVAGFGGQGILFMGKSICQAGMQMGLNVTYFPSYGAEVRGGTANCNVILSNEIIASPIVREANTVIVMNELSLSKFESMLVKGGLLLINSSLVRIEKSRNDIHTEYIPATDLAYDLGDSRVANMVMLGKYISCKEILSRKSVINTISGPLKALNVKALQAGIGFSS